MIVFISAMKRTTAPWRCLLPHSCVVLSCLWCVSFSPAGWKAIWSGATERPLPCGGVVIHRGHMRLLDLSTKDYHTLFEHLEQSGRLVREVEAQGWAPFLDGTDLSGELLPSRPAPCPRCHRPQTQCRVGLPQSEAPRDPTLPAGTPLSERPAFQHGVYVQEVFAGWAGWTAGMVQQGFRSAPPRIEYFEDPLSNTGPKPEFDLRDSMPFLKRPRPRLRLRCPTCGSSALRALRWYSHSVVP